MTTSILLICILHFHTLGTPWLKCISNKWHDNNIGLYIPYVRRCKRFSTIKFEFHCLFSFFIFGKFQLESSTTTITRGNVFIRCDNPVEIIIFNGAILTFVVFKLRDQPLLTNRPYLNYV